MSDNFDFEFDGIKPTEKENESTVKEDEKLTDNYRMIRCCFICRFGDFRMRTFRGKLLRNSPHQSVDCHANDSVDKTLAYMVCDKFELKSFFFFSVATDDTNVIFDPNTYKAVYKKPK